MKPILLSLFAAGFLFSGCAQTSRYVTTSHWHDKDSLLLAYTENVYTDYIFASSNDDSAHVKLCRIEESNAVTCKAQPAIDQLLLDSRN